MYWKLWYSPWSFIIPAGFSHLLYTIQYSYTPFSIYKYLEHIGFDIYNKVLDYKGNSPKQDLGSVLWSESQTTVKKLLLKQWFY